MKIIRFILGRIILFLDWITSPRPNQISEEKRNEINSFTSNMVMYEFKACHFCVRVRIFMKKNNKNGTLVLEVKRGFELEIQMEQIKILSLANNFFGFNLQKINIVNIILVCTSIVYIFVFSLILPNLTKLFPSQMIFNELKKYIKIRFLERPPNFLYKSNVIDEPIYKNHNLFSQFICE